MGFIRIGVSLAVSSFVFAWRLHTCSSFHQQVHLLSQEWSHPQSHPQSQSVVLRSTADDYSNQSTNAILRISYDGGRFTGWSAANSGDSDAALDHSNKNNKTPSWYYPPGTSKHRRRRGLVGDMPKGFVRPVEGIIRDNLAKIYGNIDPKRIVVEGCSRTDRGVHSQGMIAQIYCLKEGVLETLEDEKHDRDANNDQNRSIIHCSIPGKRKPHPESPSDDSYFERLPMNGNLSRLVFALNRMRPRDVHITAIAPTPTLSGQSTTPFHPSLSSCSKTYEYRLSVGAFQDPTIKRVAWHTGHSLDLEQIQKGCSLLEGTHDFAAFQGAPRGKGDKKKRENKKGNDEASVCTLMRVKIEEEIPPLDQIYFPGVVPALQTYKVVIEGDRFLYKMVRFLVGVLVAVGSGKLQLEDVERALNLGNWDIPNKERGTRNEFKCAPAHGLVLSNINYGDILMDWKPLRY